MDMIKADTQAFWSKEKNDVEYHFHSQLSVLKNLKGKDKVSICMKHMYHYGLCKTSAIFLRIILREHQDYTDEWENFYDDIVKRAGLMEDWIKSNRNRSSNNSTSREGTPNLNKSANRRNVDEGSNRRTAPLPVLEEER